jgi:invasion protein IalB
MMRMYRPAILALLGSLAAFTVSGAIAQEQTQPSTDMPATTTFGRWTTIIDALDTGQDSHKTCAASTAFLDGNGNAGTLTLSISTGDALPPDAYPAIMFSVANKDLPTGKKIAATFGDPGVKISTTVYSNDAVGGRPSWTVDNQAKTSLALLRAMRQVISLDVVFGKQAVASIPMDGFTKAYRNLGTSCGFPTKDVAP